MPVAATTAAVAAVKKRDGDQRRPALATTSVAAVSNDDLVPEGPTHPVVRLFGTVLEIINSTMLQTILYIALCVILLSLQSTMRKPEEFYFDKHVMDRIVENHFDSSHNTFESVRRVGDIWEWGNTVLMPGLFADLGPCNGDNVGSRTASRTCEDDVWPDGDGSFHLSGASRYEIGDIVERFDQFDWTDGISIRQARAHPAECTTTDQRGPCLPELQGDAPYSREAYGYNYTDPSSNLTQPFEYFSAAQLGANPDGISSAAIESLRDYESGGFFAFALPFFSENYLPEEEGESVTDHTASVATPSNGKASKYFCVRTSVNGRYIRQLCDPGANGDGTGALTGAVRRHVETWWNDLKRAHFIDTRSRVVTIVLQLRSNHVGLRYRISLMFEITSLGAIFASYDVESRITEVDRIERRGILSAVGLAMVIFFCLIEGIELFKGPFAYLQDVWNVMDWANFIIFFMTFAQLQQVSAAEASWNDCTSEVCSSTGYFDDWKLMSEYKETKTFLSMCVCIQLLKILKFTSVLVPKMGLATDVLRFCAMDLIFFGVTMIISMGAFSMMMYVQLGNVMEGFVFQTSSFISLFRALFGDFDIDAILSNSKGYLNAVLFLVYLFVAVFIMLSMFLAILAEAQVLVNAKVNEKKTPGAEGYDETYDEYGVLSKAGGAVEGLVALLRGGGDDGGGGGESTTAASATAASAPAQSQSADSISSTPSMQSPQSLPPAMDRPAPVLPSRPKNGSTAASMDAMNETMMMMLGEIRHLKGQVDLLRAQVAVKAEGSVVRATVPTPLDNTRLRTSGVAQRSVDEAPSARMSPMPSWSTGGGGLFA